MTASPIRASGGVVVRPTGADGVEVLVVHRPSYDDWSLPKGKDDPGETPQEAALREVHEETGYRARIVEPLRAQHYTVAGGRAKEVAYYIMRPTRTEGFEPNAEVDETRWLDIGQAQKLLTYDHDRDLLDDPRIAKAARSGRVFLIRHAQAGDRSTWKGDDRFRPITNKGRRQSESITREVAGHGVDAIRSSPYVRCMQTMESLATSTGLPIIEDYALAEGADAAVAFELVTRSAGASLALCSHGDVIPDLLERLSRSGTKLQNGGGSLQCSKGSVWEITVDNGVPTTATYTRPRLD